VSSIRCLHRSGVMARRLLRLLLFARRHHHLLLLLWQHLLCGEVGAMTLWSLSTCY
jgi:hypothetical protein